MPITEILRTLLVLDVSILARAAPSFAKKLPRMTGRVFGRPADRDSAAARLAHDEAPVAAFEYLEMVAAIRANDFFERRLYVLVLVV